MKEKPGPHDQGLSRKHIMEACEASLRRLKTDVIDLYQVHMQDTSVRIEETLRALDDLVTQGKVRYIGCSNYTGYRLIESLWAAEKAHTHRYESVQLQWSLLERGAEREVVPACKANDLGVLVWSPLASGFLSGKYRRGQPPPEGARLTEWKDTMKRIGEGRSYDLIDVLEKVAQASRGDPGAGRDRVAARATRGLERHPRRSHRRAARRQPPRRRDQARARGREGARRRLGARLGVSVRVHRSRAGRVVTRNLDEMTAVASARALSRRRG